MGRQYDMPAQKLHGPDPSVRCAKVRYIARLIYERTSRVIGLNVVYLLMFNGHDTTLLCKIHVHKPCMQYIKHTYEYKCVYEEYNTLITISLRALIFGRRLKDGVDGRELVQFERCS